MITWPKRHKGWTALPAAVVDRLTCKISKADVIQGIECSVTSGECIPATLLITKESHSATS